MMNVIKILILWGVLILSVFSNANTEIKLSDNQLVRSGYKITLSENKNAIFVAGKFNHGISNDVINIYEKNKSTVKTIMYSSSGGKLHESVTLYKLALQNNLNTYAINYCYSACTTAFVGGHNRVTLVQTKFGFHQFGAKSFKNLASDNVVIIDAQNKNTVLFQKQGVKDDFLSQIYKAKSSEMWNPDIINLLKSNVVHEIVLDQKKITDFDITNKFLYPDVLALN